MLTNDLIQAMLADLPTVQNKTGYDSFTLKVIRSPGYDYTKNKYFGNTFYRAMHLFDEDSAGLLLDATGGYQRVNVFENDRVVPLVYHLFKRTKDGEESLLGEGQEFYTVDLSRGECNCRAKQGHGWRLFKRGSFTKSGQDVLVAHSAFPPETVDRDTGQAWSEVLKCFPTMGRVRHKYRVDPGSAPAADCKHLLACYASWVITGK